MALILTREDKEGRREICIGDDITVSIIGVQGGQVRVAVEAPKDVAVHRREIADRIKAEQTQDIPRLVNAR